MWQCTRILSVQSDIHFNGSVACLLMLAENPPVRLNLGFTPGGASATYVALQVATYSCTY